MKHKISYSEQRYWLEGSGVDLSMNAMVARTLIGGGLRKSEVAELDVTCRRVRARYVVKARTSAVELYDTEKRRFVASVRLCGEEPGFQKGALEAFEAAAFLLNHEEV